MLRGTKTLGNDWTIRRNYGSTNAMSLRIVTSRRFAPMFGAMALAAFNDNFYKNALIILITYRLAADDGQRAAFLISLASAAFIVPFFLFSGLAGNIADKISKSRWVRLLKLVELGLYIVAGIALHTEHVWFMLGALFLLGALSSFFGPVKYAILPELLAREEILPATGMVEGGTYVSILVGTLLGALLVLHPNGYWIVSATMLAIGVAGVLAAWRVPHTVPAQPNLVLRWNIVASIWDMLKVAWRNPTILAAIFGISWFWSIGATYLTQLPVFTKEVVGADERVVSLFMGIFTVGIAVGSLVCARIVRRVPGGILSPLALAGVMLTGLDLCWVGFHLPAPGGDLIGLGSYFDSLAHVRILADLTLMSFCGGLFIVPLYALLQTDSAEGERARTIASNNVVNALFIAVASLLTALLYRFNFEVREVLLLFAVLNVPIIALLWRRRKV